MKLLIVLLLAIVLLSGVSKSAIFSDSSATGPVQIVEVLPFAGGDNVRIEVRLKAEATVPVQGLEIRAAIVPWPEGETLWNGSLGRMNLTGSEETVVSQHVTGLQPALWSPTSPNLYNLVVEVVRGDEVLDSTIRRFGFRTVEARDGRIYLNGTPIFLRGHAINPPGRGVPDEVGQSREFVEQYIRDMKDRNVNLIRPGYTYSETWMDVCDELGVMIFAGRYGSPPGATHNIPPEDFDESIRSYKSQVFERFQRHPSIVITIVTNEMAQRDEAGAAYDAYLERAWRALREWDPNRLYIGNAGFGRGHGGELYDVHPYWGWYAGSFFDVYRFREPYVPSGRPGAAPPPRPNQPVTITECIGAYTTEKGHFRIDRKQLSAALRWAGHAPDQDAEAREYQAILTGQYVEIVRRLRDLSPTLAGIMPFTRSFIWDGASSYQDVEPKPVADQIRVSLQPILLSWENWRPNVYSGAEVKISAHIVNDSNEAEDLIGARLVYRLKGSNDETILSNELSLPDVPYYDMRTLPVTITLPQTLPTGEYTLVGDVVAGNGNRIISSNTTDFFVAAKDWPNGGRALEREVFLYDPVGKTASALTALGIRFSRIDDFGTLRPDSVLIIAEDCWDGSIAQKSDVFKAFTQQGGRLLVLRQKERDLAFDWLPTAIMSGPEREGLWINPERPDHPIFSGIGRERLRYWSDYTNWNPSVEGIPQVHPATSRFRLQEPVDFSATAVLAGFGRSLANIALCQVFDGKGSTIMSGFDLINRFGFDPVADRLLCNLVFYAASNTEHQRHPFIDSPIRWGHYGSERGVITGPFHGLLENWDNLDIAGIDRRPGTDGGRRPFGWYEFGGGTGTYVVDTDPDSETASGVFCATIPAGRKNVLTLVANPGETPATLELEINGTKSGDTATIPAGQMVTIRNPLPGAVTEVCVKYTGHKSLVLLETSFE